MGRSRYKTFDDGCTYFVTSTAIQWLPLFAMPALADIVINSLIHHHQNGLMSIHAWVLMETHMHLVATSKDMSGHMRNMKAFTAKCILDYLKGNGPDLFLSQMSHGKKKHKMDQEYQVWQEGFHPKQIVDESMLNIKMDYVHYNPVKRGYVDKPEHWRYSSARDYAGTEGLVPISRLS